MAVSSRGNFYMTWTPGQTFWMPHNRPAARRLQNMGFTPSGQVWVTTRGGDVLINQVEGLAEEKFENVAINSRGFGILDVGWVRAGGGGGRRGGRRGRLRQGGLWSAGRYGARP